MNIGLNLEESSLKEMMQCHEEEMRKLKRKAIGANSTIEGEQELREGAKDKIEQEQGKVG